MKFGLKYPKWFGKIGNMNFIITESKLEKTIIQWLNKNYGHLNLFKSKKQFQYIFFIKDKNVIIFYDTETEVLYVPNDHIGYVLKEMLGIEKYYAELLINIWVTQKYNIHIKQVSFGNFKNLPKINDYEPIITEEQYKRIGRYETCPTQVTFEVFTRITARWKQRTRCVSDEFYQLIQEYQDNKFENKAIPEQLRELIEEYYYETYYLNPDEYDISFITGNTISVKVKPHR